MSNIVSRLFGLRPNAGYIERTVSGPDQLEKAMVLRDGAPDAPESALRIAAVHACVDLLSGVVASRPISVMRKENKRLVAEESHSVADLLTNEPNHWQTPYDFMRLVAACVLLRGNFYAQKVGRGSKIDALFPLDPARMKPEQRPDKTIKYVYRLDNSEPVEFSAAEILHIKALSLDGITGIGVLDAAKHNIAHLDSMGKWNRAFFKNGATPGGVLQHPQALSPEAFARLRGSFDDNFSGAENAHRPLILEEGLTWQSISISAETMQFIETFKFSRSEIAMFFGIPPHMIGDIERGTSWGSGLEQQNVAFLTYRLGPMLVNYSQAMQRDLFSRSDRRIFRIVFDTSALTRADFATRQTGLEKMKKNGIISANEWRAVEGMDPVANGDEYKIESAPAPTEKRDESEKADDPKPTS